MNICPNCSYLGDERACPRDGFPMMDESVFTHAQGEADLLGKVFDGRYLIEEQVGAGGMGCVWKARHLTMQCEVALKVMRSELSRNLSAVRRFYQEARASAQLKHPHTIRVHDFGASEDGLLYLAMEYLDGEPLSRLVKRRGPLPPLQAIRIARQVCGSLDEAHDHGMVHRDLKPDNIYLSQVHRIDDFVKVLDFGIAKVAGSAATGPDALTSTGLVVGTPKYVSPEQAQARPVDRRSDLYSLGIILYEMLTGRVPFQAPSAAALLVQHVAEAPPPLPSQVDGLAVPEPLRALVAQMLAKRPEDRPETAAEVDRRLASIVPMCSEASEEDRVTEHMVIDERLRRTESGSPAWLEEATARHPSMAAYARTATDRRETPAVDDQQTGDVQWPPPHHRGRWALLAVLALAGATVAVALVVVPYGSRVGPADAPAVEVSRWLLRPAATREVRVAERRRPEPTPVVAGEALPIALPGGGDARGERTASGLPGAAAVLPAPLEAAAADGRSDVVFEREAPPPVREGHDTRQALAPVGAGPVEAEPAERRLRTHLEPSPVVTSEPTPERHRERPPKGKKPATPDRPILVTPPPVEAEPPDPPPRGYEIDYGL